MGLFPSSRGNKYILGAVDYVSKRVGAIASPTNDSPGSLLGIMVLIPLRGNLKLY